MLTVSTLDSIALIQAAMGRRSGSTFSPPVAIDRMPGKDVFGQPAKDEKPD